MAGMITEVGLRERDEVLRTAAYQDLRRENSAVHPCVALMEFSLGIDLPGRVHANEHFSTLYWNVIDMVYWVRRVRCGCASLRTDLLGLQANVWEDRLRAVLC